MVPDTPDDEDMSLRQTPPLSPDGVQEILAELSAPPADTPERRATLERARAMQFLVNQAIANALSRKHE